MLKTIPLTVRSRGRLYTTDRHRREIDVTATENPSLVVCVERIKRDVQWDGYCTQAGTFTATMTSDGAVTIPKGLRERFAIEEGETLRVSLSRNADRVRSG